MKNIKLVRSRENKMFAGVLGGFGNMIGVDATILRVVYAFATIFTGFFPLVFAYIVCAIIIPLEDENIQVLEADASSVVIEQDDEK